MGEILIIGLFIWVVITPAICLYLLHQRPTRTIEIGVRDIVPFIRPYDLEDIACGEPTQAVMNRIYQRIVEELDSTGGYYQN
jgi:hypothetical protein